MIELGHPALSVAAQCRLLSISRSPFYHEAQGETEANLELFQRQDGLQLVSTKSAPEVILAMESGAACGVNSWQALRPAQTEAAVSRPELVERP